MTIKTDIEQLVVDATKVHSWSNGNVNHSETFGGLNVRSPAKLIADKDEQINVAANGLLTQTTAAATNAATQATKAANSAASVASQALTASAQANISITKASEAAASATHSSTSASASASSAASAAASLVSVNSVFDSFDDRYLGAKYSDPTLDNDGNALVAGTVYYNTTSSTLRFYNGAAWEAPTAAAATSANNAMNSQNAAATSATASAGSAASSAGSAATAATTLSATQLQAVRAADWAEKVSATVDGTGYSAKHWAGAAASSAAAVTTNTIIPTEYFTATAEQTDFTLARGVGHPGSILVIASGVTQAPISAYTVPSINTLRFTDGLTAGIQISVRYLDKEAQSGAAAAQEWATKTGAAVSGSAEYSSKHYALASADSAATSTTKASEGAASAVSAAGSASTATTKAGEAAVSASGAAGSLSSVQAQAVLASEWAQKIGATVAGGGYSAKHWAGEAAGSAAAVTTNTIIPTEHFTASAGQTDFTLLRGVGYPGSILVVAAGVTQTPIDAYTVPNINTLRFVTGLESGSKISVRYLDKEAQSGAAAAQEWATKVGSPVTGSSEFSAKHYSLSISANAETASQQAINSANSATASAGSATASANSAGASSASATQSQSYMNQAQGYAAAAGGSNVAPQIFTGNGNAVDFALTTASVNVHKLMVSVANVVQDSLEAYLLVNSGATLRFTGAPYNGARIVVRYI